MNINLNLLPITLDDDIIIPESFYKDTDIKRLDNLHVKGIIKYDLSDEVIINLVLTGKMIIIDSITLEEITNDLNINIDTNLEEITSESAYFYEKNKNILDIIEFLWENIVLEVPISYTKEENVSLSGKGWEFNKTQEDNFKGGE